MMPDRLDREDQDTYLREIVDAADARPNTRHRPKPPDDSPNRCFSNLPTSEHDWWFSSRDGLKRCYYCCAVKWPDGHIVRITDAHYPGRQP
jgi:hypothetical protein